MLTNATIRDDTPIIAGRRDCRPFGAHSLADAFDLVGAAMTFPRDAEIHGEDEPADFFYKVITGTVRAYRVLSDGRRQIAAFYMPGDVFGFETGPQHALSAEAVTDTKLLVIKRSSMMALAARDHSVAQLLLRMTMRELARAQDHIMLLVKTAQERVAAFLLEMADRVQRCSEVDLPMSRQDIADYLGLTIETVSRTLTNLESTAAIALPTSRRIILCDRRALSRLNG
jgi:CRP/FNR family nitrogen fixation transcriptional regulator